jgi:N-acetylglucosaminyl-diphospho-decaprenol L-rhamnosyltransferase
LSGLAREHHNSPSRGSRVPAARVDVVIVNWNAGAQLRACLETLATDNASSDGSAESIDPHGMALHVVRNPDNRGFAAACNQGARFGSADYVLFLNPDVRLESNSLDVAIEALDDPANRQAAIAGVQLYDEAGHTARNCARFPTPWTMVVRAIGLDRVRMARSYVMDDWPHDTTRVVDHVMGAFYLVRRGVFAQLRGFDERFFVYLEDVDFSVRARAAGWHSLYLTRARAFHKGGGTSERAPADRLAYAVRSRLVYARKHFTAPGRIFVGLATLVIEPWVRIGRAAILGQSSGVTDVIRAYRQVFARQVR